MSKLLEELEVDLEDLVVHINQTIKREVKAQVVEAIKKHTTACSNQNPLVENGDVIGPEGCSICSQSLR